MIVTPDFRTSPLVPEKVRQKQPAVSLPSNRLKPGIRFGTRLRIAKDAKLMHVLETLSKALEANHVVAGSDGKIYAGGKAYELKYEQKPWSDVDSGGLVSWTLSSPTDKLSVRLWGMSKQMKWLGAVVPPFLMATGLHAAFPIFYVTHTDEKLTYRAAQGQTNYKLRRVIKKLHQLVNQAKQFEQKQAEKAYTDKGQGSEAEKLKRIMTWKPDSDASTAAVPATDVTTPSLRSGEARLEEHVELTQIFGQIEKALEAKQLVIDQYGKFEVGGGNYSISRTEPEGSRPAHLILRKFGDRFLSLQLNETTSITKRFLVNALSPLYKQFGAPLPRYPEIYVSVTEKGGGFSNIDVLSYSAAPTSYSYKVERLVKTLCQLAEKAAKTYWDESRKDSEQNRLDKMKNEMAKPLPGSSVEAAQPSLVVAPAPKTTATVSDSSTRALEPQRQEFKRLLAELNTVRATKNKIRQALDADVARVQASLKPLQEQLTQLKQQVLENPGDSHTQLVLDHELQELKVKAKADQLQLLTQQQETTKELETVMDHRLKRMEFQYTHALEMLDTMERLGQAQQLQSLFNTLDRQYKENSEKALPNTAMQKQFNELVTQLAQAEQDTRLMREILQMDAESALKQLRVKERVESAKAEMGQVMVKSHPPLTAQGTQAKEGASA